MWMIAANFRRTHTQVNWLGLRVGGHPALSLHSSNEPCELSQGLWSWWQHHKHCRGYYEIQPGRLKMRGQKMHNLKMTDSSNRISGVCTMADWKMTDKLVTECQGLAKRKQEALLLQRKRHASGSESGTGYESVSWYDMDSQLTPDSNPELDTNSDSNSDPGSRSRARLWLGLGSGIRPGLAPRLGFGSKLLLGVAFRTKLRREVDFWRYPNFRTTERSTSHSKPLWKRISSICSSVSIELRLVTDTDRHRPIASTPR